jgi:hypothetical protein
MALFQWPWHKPAPKAEVAEQPRQLDPLNDRDMNEWMERQFAAGVETVKDQIRNLQARGILDENGKRISKELPAEMLAGDKPSDVA